eukprot:m.200638 g.200638  ORF g.200638 m.200638 type:complete len:528 (+) comp21121_c0_seq1:210-1793(+)
MHPMQQMLVVLFALCVGCLVFLGAGHTTSTAVDGLTSMSDMSQLDNGDDGGIMQRQARGSGKIVLVTADTRDFATPTNSSHLRAATVYTFMYKMQHPETEFVFYKPKLIDGNRATSTLDFCRGHEQKGARHVVAEASSMNGPDQTRRNGSKGLPGPDGCVLGDLSWAQVPALQHAHRTYPDADYVVWHDGDAVINPDYFNVSLHAYLQSIMPLQDGPPARPIMLNLEQGNWWCSQTKATGAPCFNVGTIVLHGHGDARVREWLQAWWKTSTEATDTEPSNINQRNDFMGNPKGLTLTVIRPEFAKLIQNAPPGVERAGFRDAQLANKNNGFKGLWRFEGSPLSKGKPKGAGMSVKDACVLLERFLPSRVNGKDWLGTTTELDTCNLNVKCHCRHQAADDTTTCTEQPEDTVKALFQHCVHNLRPMPPACLVGMPNFGCFMYHFYSNREYKQYWGGRLSHFAYKFAIAASTCNGQSPLPGTNELCGTFQKLFNLSDNTLQHENETLYSLASTIEGIISVDLPWPDWVA